MLLKNYLVMRGVIAVDSWRKLELHICLRKCVTEWFYAMQNGRKKAHTLMEIIMAGKTLLSYCQLFRSWMIAK